MFTPVCRQTILFAKTHTSEVFCFLSYISHLYKIGISMLALKRAIFKTWHFQQDV